MYVHWCPNCCTLLSSDGDTPHGDIGRSGASTVQCSHHTIQPLTKIQSQLSVLKFRHTRGHTAAASAEAGTCQQPPPSVPLLLPAVTSPASLLLSCCCWRRPRVVPLSWKEAQREAGEAARPGRCVARLLWHGPRRGRLQDTGRHWLSRAQVAAQPGPRNAVQQPGSTRRWAPTPWRRGGGGGRW